MAMCDKKDITPVILSGLLHKIQIKNNLTLIHANIPLIILKRISKLIEQNGLLNVNLSSFMHEFNIINQNILSGIDMVFICVNINQASLEIIKQFYPVSSSVEPEYNFKYIMLDENELITQFPEYYDFIPYYKDGEFPAYNDFYNTYGNIGFHLGGYNSVYNPKYELQLQDRENVGFDNTISCILEDDKGNGILFLTDNTGSQNIEKVIELGITHIINATDLLPNYFEEDARFSYLRIPIMDSPEINITDYFKSAFEFIDNAFAQGGKVVVHCFAGKSRSASIVIGYIMTKKTMKFNEALKMVITKRPIVEPNLGFMAQLINLEKNI